MPLNTRAAATEKKAMRFKNQSPKERWDAVALNCGRAPGPGKATENRAARLVGLGYAAAHEHPEAGH